MRINLNVPALAAQRHVGEQAAGLRLSLERLSSGLRINRAADDSAGMAVSTSMRAKLAGYAQASANVQDGINLMQTAEGGFTAVTDVLQRLRELTVQAANDTYSPADREKIQTEVSQLIHEIDRQADTTEFNGRALIGRKPRPQPTTAAGPPPPAMIDPGTTFGFAFGGNVTLQNNALAMSVMNGGLFGTQNAFTQLATVQGFTTASDDDGKLILYDPAVTSDTILRIDGHDVDFGTMMDPSVAVVSPPTLVGSDTIRTVHSFANGKVQVQRDVRLQGFFVTVSYTMTNTDTQAHDVGTRVLLDTKLDTNDGAIIRENGAVLPQVTFYSGSTMPDRLDAYEGSVNPNLQSSAIAKNDPDVLTPDVFGAVNWPTGFGSFDYPGGGGAPIGADTAVWYQYQPRTLAAGASQKIAAVKYGLTRAGSVPPTAEPTFQPGNELVFHVGNEVGQTFQVQQADLSAENLDLATMDVTGAPAATAAWLTKIDKALDYVNTERARLGGAMNELSAHGSMLAQTQLDTTASVSRLADTDVASESAALVKRQILAQAGTAMLSQAQTTSEQALRLLAAH